MDKSKIKNKKLRVVFISAGYPSTDRPNYAIFIHRSVKKLSKYIDVKVIHLRTWRPFRPIIEKRTWDNINIVSLSIPQIPIYKLGYINSFLLSLIGFWFIKKYLKNSDLIHSTSIYPIGFVTNQWSIKLEKPHVSQAIGRDVNVYLENLPENKIQWIRTINQISCNSNALKEKLNYRLPNLDNIRVINRGVDTNYYSPEGAVNKLIFEKPELKYLYLGGFQTWNPREFNPINYKGGHILLSAWKIAETQLGSSILIMGGAGSNPDKLAEWRSSLRNPDNIIILPVIDPAEVPSLIRSCNVVVIPSISDGLPNLANEAQACGCPVLGTDAGGIPETVISNLTGYIVNRNNPQALAQGLLWFFKNQNEIPKMGEEARRRMIELFSWEKFSSQMLDLYNELIDK